MHKKQIYILQNGEQTGPFSREDIQNQMVAGTIKNSDLGWQFGMGEHEPLWRIIQRADPTGPRSGIWSDSEVKISHDHRPVSRAGAICKQLLKAVAVMLITCVIIYIITQTVQDKTTAIICDFVVVCICCGITQSMIDEISNSCSNCKKLGTMQSQKRTLLRQDVSCRLDYKTATHRNRDGRIVGYSQVPLERTDVTNTYEQNWICSNCGYTKCKIEVEK